MTPQRTLLHSEFRSALRNLARALLLCLGGCTGLPENVTPVGDFRLDKYLGTWYEIARLDHSFERELTRVTAGFDTSKLIFVDHD
jgi:lipocalin